VLVSERGNASFTGSNGGLPKRLRIDRRIEWKWRSGFDGR
jgi:hypothetical protein